MSFSKPGSSGKAKKARAIFVCTACGNSSAQWLGRCPTCQAWDSLLEERVDQRPSASANVAGDWTKPTALGDVPADSTVRISTGLEELDRVLGGGVVLGSIVLLGGDPGIGKSTLLMQALAGMASHGRTVLYASGEESAAQIALRGRRLDLKGIDRVLVQATTELEELEAAIDALKPSVVVVDSIQTLRSRDLELRRGSLSSRSVAASPSSSSVT